jgi:hypothetical protein
MPHTAFLNSWKDAFDIWEKYTAHYWDGVLRSPLFLEILGRNLELTLTWQRATLTSIDVIQRAWGLPTRAEQDVLKHHLNQLTTRVNQLARRVEALEEGKA